MLFLSYKPLPESEFTWKTISRSFLSSSYPGQLKNILWYKEQVKYEFNSLDMDLLQDTVITYHQISRVLVYSSKGISLSLANRIRGGGGRDGRVML